MKGEQPVGEKKINLQFTQVSVSLRHRRGWHMVDIFNFWASRLQEEVNSGVHL